MQPPEPIRVTSRDNPLLVALRKLASDPRAYRKSGAVWLEGEHLCEASLKRGRVVAQAVLTEAAWDTASLRALAEQAGRIAIVSDALFESVSGLESHGRIGFLIDHEATAQLRPGLQTVILDRLQDAGNVGTILRTAAALGVQQVAAMKGCAALWSPKVLRAGMGAHFGLHLVESCEVETLAALDMPWIAGSSHAESALTDARLPQPCAWVFGHEGQGVSGELMRRCSMTIRIPQPGGEESLNVASAAAICLYESLRQRSAGAGVTAPAATSGPA
ncbi:RNA methyltransferase [soil metagenome]